MFCANFNFQTRPRADASEGRLNNIIYDTEYSEKAVLVTYDKDGNVTLEDVSKDFDWSNQ